MQAEHIRQLVAEGGGTFRHFFYGQVNGMPGVLVVFSEEGESDVLTLPAQYVTPENVREAIIRSHWFGWLVLWFKRLFHRARKTKRLYTGETNGIAHNFRRIE